LIASRKKIRICIVAKVAAPSLKTNNNKNKSYCVSVSYISTTEQGDMGR
jgi:hypothetical protein